jgi:hypothetical protein
MMSKEMKPYNALRYEINPHQYGPYLYGPVYIRRARRFPKSNYHNDNRTKKNEILEDDTVIYIRKHSHGNEYRQQ